MYSVVTASSGKLLYLEVNVWGGGYCKFYLLYDVGSYSNSKFREYMLTMRWIINEKCGGRLPKEIYGIYP